jgi:hypothetical protein
VTTLLAAAALLVTPGPSRAAEPIINIDRSDGAINFSVDVYDYCGDGVGECADLSITLSRDGRKNTETIADPRSRDGEFLFAHRIPCAGSGELGWSITVSAVDGRASLGRSRRVTLPSCRPTPASRTAQRPRITSLHSSQRGVGPPRLRGCRDSPAEASVSRSSVDALGRRPERASRRA